MQFRVKYDDKNPSVVRLQEDCDREYQKLCQANAIETEKLRSYITELSELIEQAEAKQSELLSSPYLEKLKSQKDLALKETEHKVPSLSVYVKQ